tara:strand:+ start:12085 stop:12612 length:528 start_codon:yes stop_codon:yes gene_type:complete
MAYTANNIDGVFKSINSSNFFSIPLDPSNRHYQEVLDAIIEQGADCFDGDIPTELQAAADAKLFAKQLKEYKTATARLAQYEVEKGRDEVKETRNTGRKVQNDKEEWVDETEEIIIQSKIDPVEPTITRWMYSDDLEADPTQETIENPLITKDKAERAEAQAVVDATPQAVKDAA